MNNKEKLQFIYDTLHFSLFEIAKLGGKTNTLYYKQATKAMRILFGLKNE